MSTFGKIEPFLMDFDFKPSDTNVTPPAIEVEPKAEKEETKTQETKDDTKVTDDKKLSTEIEIADLDLGNPVDLLDIPKEEQAEEQVENPYVNVINTIYSEVFNEDMKPYEGFSDEEEPTMEMLVKLVNHNLELAKQESQIEFVSSLSPLAQRIVEMDINANSESEVKSLISSLLEEDNIKSLSVDNEFDQERIVRKWFSNENWTSQEVDEKVKELRDANLLQKEAQRIKPKLDAKAEEIAKKQEEAAKAMRDLEKRYDASYLDKIGTTLQGKVAGISLTKEEATKVYTLLDPQKRQFDIGDKKVEMTLLERYLLGYKYSQDADTEALTLAAHILLDKENFLNKLKKSVQTEETNRFIREKKYEDQVRTGGLKVQTEKKAPEVTKSQWKLKI